MTRKHARTQTQLYCWGVLNTFNINHMQNVKELYKENLSTEHINSNDLNRTETVLLLYVNHIIVPF